VCGEHAVRDEVPHLVDNGPKVVVMSGHEIVGPRGTGAGEGLVSCIQQQQHQQRGVRRLA
jgi:hypothetical protein